MVEAATYRDRVWNLKVGGFAAGIVGSTTIVLVSLGQEQLALPDSSGSGALALFVGLLAALFVLALYARARVDVLPDAIIVVNPLRTVRLDRKAIRHVGPRQVFIGSYCCKVRVGSSPPGKSVVIIGLAFDDRAVLESHV